MAKIARKTPYHRSGTATVTATPVDVTYNSDGVTYASFFTIHVKNGTLRISFDGGTNYATVPGGASFDLEDARLFTVYLKTDAGTADYEIICKADRRTHARI